VRPRSEAGWANLTELVAVLVVAAVLGSIAVIGYRHQIAQTDDIVACSMLADAIADIESGSRNYYATIDGLTVEDIMAQDPDHAVFLADAATALDPHAGVVGAVYFSSGPGRYTYDAGTRSSSGKTFGVHVTKTSRTLTPANCTYYVNGQPHTW
jgi:hypothetical protein